MYDCPVCGYNAMKKPPADHSICPCCGVEFGLDDAGPALIDEIHAGLRRRWLTQGMKWHSQYLHAPSGWNAIDQLVAAGLYSDLPKLPSLIAANANIADSSHK
jgi:hypothetical protein